MINQIKIPLNNYVDKKKNRYFDYFCTGFVVYAAAYCYSSVEMKNYKIAIPFQIFGLILIVFSSIKLLKFKIINRYLKTLFIIYCGWVFFMIILRGFTFDYQFIKDLLFDAERGLFIYLVPLGLLLPQNFLFYKKIFKTIAILAVIFITYDLLFIRNLLNVQDYFLDVSSTKYTYDYFVKILSVPIGFLILTYRYHSKKIKILSIFVVAIAILFSIIRARRALIFLSICPLFIGSIFYSIYSKNVLIIFTYILIVLFFLFKGPILMQNNPRIFNLLLERVDDDTRTPVEACFYEDMKIKDWIIGKGINGEYYCANIDANDASNYRNAIETDYLNIILKGGIITIIIIALIMLPAIYKGLFDSRNLLSQAASIWILLWLLELYPLTVFSFSLNHLLTWISVGICYNKEIRYMPEKSMKNFFLN